LVFRVLFDLKESLLLTEQKDIDSASEVLKKPLLPKRKRNDSELESTTDMPSKKIVYKNHQIYLMIMIQIQTMILKKF
jgi:hypothetical protein